LTNDRTPKLGTTGAQRARRAPLFEHLLHKVGAMVPCADNIAQSGKLQTTCQLAVRKGSAADLACSDQPDAP
jgi:hypothetical protein